MTTKEASRLIGVPANTIGNWIRSGLHFFPAGRQLKSGVWELDEWKVKHWWMKMRHPFLYKKRRTTVPRLSV